MNTTLILIGVVCIIAAIVGGGVKAVQIELGSVSSLWRQLLLACFGAILIGAGMMVGQSGAAQSATSDGSNETAGPSSSGGKQAASGSGSGAALSGDYILPESADRNLTATDLTGLSAAQLRLARNEIYARHGMIFQSADLTDYFSKKSWYHPVVGNPALSPIEQANVLFINQYAKANSQ